MPDTDTQKPSSYWNSQIIKMRSYIYFMTLMILFYDINDSIFKLMMIIDSGILLISYPKILLLQFTKTLNRFLNLSRANKN